MLFSNVRQHVGDCSESLPAVLAFVQFVSRVFSDVILQLLPLRECLLAMRASMFLDFWTPSSLRSAAYTMFFFHVFHVLKKS